MYPFRSINSKLILYFYIRYDNSPFCFLFGIFDRVSKCMALWLVPPIAVFWLPATIYQIRKVILHVYYEFSYTDDNLKKIMAIIKVYKLSQLTFHCYKVVLCVRRRQWLSGGWIKYFCKSKWVPIKLIFNF